MSTDRQMANAVERALGGFQGCEHKLLTRYAWERRNRQRQGQLNCTRQAQWKGERHGETTFLCTQHAKVRARHYVGAGRSLSHMASGAIITDTHSSYTIKRRIERIVNGKEMSRTPEQKARIAELILAGHKDYELVECDECGWIGYDDDQPNPTWEDDQVDRLDMDRPMSIDSLTDYMHPGSVIPSGHCPVCFKEEDVYVSVFPFDAPKRIPAEQKNVLPLGKLTKDQWLEVLQGLEMRAHFRTVRGTTHQDDIAAVYEQIRQMVNESYSLDIPKLTVTGNVVIIQPPRRGL